MRNNELEKRTTGLNPFDFGLKDMLDNFFGNQLQFENTAKANLKNYDNNYLIEVQIPGFNKDNIEVYLKDDFLVIQGNIENENKQDNENTYRREFKKNSFVRTFQLPNNVNKDNIEANSEDGILYVKIPKEDNKKEENKKKIEIK